MMKQLLIITNIILFILLLFFACGRNTRTPETSGADPCLTAACAALENYADFNDEEMISWGLAKQMSIRYASDTGKKFINHGTTITTDKDALSVTFSLEKLKKLIWLIEQKTCSLHCDAIDRLGIRFYFGKYPENVGPGSNYHDLRTLPPTYANKHTLFMMPAYLKNDKWYDFNPFGKYPCPSSAPTAPMDTSKIILLMPAPGGTSGSDLDNHGGIAPPPDGGTFPTREY